MVGHAHNQHVDVGVDMVLDVIPGDMVLNAMMAAMAAHSEEIQDATDAQAAVPPVYHATSSLCNPVTYYVLYESGLRHFYKNTRAGFTKIAPHGFFDRQKLDRKTAKSSS
jgi:hypothetical protein